MPELLRVGYFGSYARDDWGPGSDLDLVAIVRDCKASFLDRALEWDLTSLPVPAEILVYTEEEWLQMQREPNRFARMLAADTIWF
jgi:predicted nucleotidyltransferase